MAERLPCPRCPAAGLVALEIRGFHIHACGDVVFASDLGPDTGRIAEAGARAAVAVVMKVFTGLVESLFGSAS